MDAYHGAETPVSANAPGMPAHLRRNANHRHGWSDSCIDRICAMLVEHHSYAEIGTAIGVTRSAVGGQINRMRQSGDVRLPPLAKKTVMLKLTTQRQIDDLAELMANGCQSIVAAARAMGLSNSRADLLWQRIRREVGWQAV